MGFLRHLKPPKRNIILDRSEVERIGLDHSHWQDPYHLMLTLPWSSFLLLLGLGYFVSNAGFALLYILGGDCLANAQPGSWSDAFFFSVQTMASIGYGAIYPKTLYANAIVTVESLVGLLFLAMGTGIMFARFSQPTARVLFSRVVIIAPHNGVPTLMFRTANQRHNQILEAQLNVNLLKTEVNQEGEVLRRFHELKLTRNHSPIFALTWTAMHPIDAESPLYGFTPETLDQEEAVLIVTLTGIDETVSQTIHSRHIYQSHDILWNYRFVDILSRKSPNQISIDYTRFHEVMPLDSQAQTSHPGP